MFIGYLSFLGAYELPAIEVIMDGRCNIYGAGHSPPHDAPSVGVHDGGLPPVFVTLDLLGSPSRIILSASGGVAFCPSCGVGGPEGIDLNSSGPPLNGISGLMNFRGRSLTACFTSDADPMDPPPPTLDFAQIGINFLSIAPQLHQLFYIGDGTADPNGVSQVIRVPAGATKLYLGLIDGTISGGFPDWYEDNSGSFTINVIAALYLDIESATGNPGISVHGPLGTTNSVESTTNLTAAGWVPITNVVLQSLPEILHDAAATADRARFYRAVKFEAGP